MTKFISAFSIACLSLLLASGASNAAEDLTQAIASGKANVDIRYRFEFVDQNGFSNDAEASTVRIRLGYETKPFRGFHARLEVDSIQAVGGENYNSTVNGKTEFPTVSDPEGSEFNQAYLHFDGPSDTSFRFGRQKVELDNKRFVAAVGFRQNEQTYDSFVLINQTLPDTRFIYGYVFNILRIFGRNSTVGEFDSDSHLINLSYGGLPFGRITAYGYLLDVEDVNTLSSQSYGVRFNGEHRLSEDLRAIYAVEFAHQTDYADNPSDFSLNYGVIEPGIGFKGLTAKIGYEILGGDGTNAFQTPLALLHGFNGLTDKFLTTPVNGIEDIYIKMKYVFADVPYVKQVSLSAAYHDLNAEEGGADYGEEWSAKVAVKLNRNFLFALAFADYQADTFGDDTLKIWTTLQFKY